MINASCPECKEIIHIYSSPEIGTIVRCGACQTVLEVTWLYPLSLDYQEKPSMKSDSSQKLEKSADRHNQGEPETH